MNMQAASSSGADKPWLSSRIVHDRAAEACFASLAGTPCGNGETIRYDAGETAIFLRSLEHLKSEVVETEYPDLRAREWLPIEPGVDEGADYMTVYETEGVGQAQFISSHADDIPRVDEKATSYAVPIQTIALGWGYSVLEIAGAKKANYKLDSRRALLVREGIERKAEHVAAKGDAARNLKGFLNSSLIPLITQSTTPEIYGAWHLPGTASTQILDDLNMMVMRSWVTSKQKHMPNQVLLGTVSYASIATRRMSDYDSRTVLQAFKESNPGVSVDSWVELDLADAQGDGERAVVYNRNPLNQAWVYPLPLRVLAPQARGLEVWIPCYARVGGVVIYRPLAHLYFDGMLDAHT